MYIYIYIYIYLESEILNRPYASGPRSDPERYSTSEVQDPMIMTNV